MRVFALQQFGDDEAQDLIAKVLEARQGGGGQQGCAAASGGDAHFVVWAGIGGGILEDMGWASGEAAVGINPLLDLGRENLGEGRVALGKDGAGGVESG